MIRPYVPTASCDVIMLQPTRGPETVAHLQHPFGDYLAHERRDVPLHALEVGCARCVSLLCLQEVLQDTIIAEEGRIRVRSALGFRGFAAQKIHDENHENLATISISVLLTFSEHSSDDSFRASYLDRSGETKERERGERRERKRKREKREKKERRTQGST